MKTQIERRLYAYLIERLMKAGTSYSTVSIADVGNRLIAADAVIVEAMMGLDLWHDKHGIPSITCMLRPYPKTVGEVVASDVFTSLNTYLLNAGIGNRFDLKRPIVQVTKQVSRIFLIEDQDPRPTRTAIGKHAGYLDFQLSFKSAVREKNQFEHDLLNAHFFK